MTLFCVYKKLFCVFFSVLIRVTNHQTPAQPPTPANHSSSHPQPSFFFAPSFFPFNLPLFPVASLSSSSSLSLSLPSLFHLSSSSSSFPSSYFTPFPPSLYEVPLLFPLFLWLPVLSTQSVILCVYAGECWSDRTIPGVYTDSTPLPAS